MSDRVVNYVFRGNFTNLTAGLAAGGKSVADFGGKLTALDKNGAKMRAGLTTVGNAAGKIGLVAAAGLGAVVIASARFDKAMSAVQAATHETAGNMDLLRAAAIKAGADTVYSAGEAAGAIESLAKAGISTKDILAGGLSGALNLAAAGNLAVADAADIAATALTQFKLQGADVGHVADLLAAGAGKAQGDVSDLGMALKQSGLVAAQTGLSIEETTGTLAAFASAGLIGSDAGTSFKTMLQALTPSGAKAANEMDRLGISAYDAQGNFVGMTEFAGNLRGALAGLSVEQQNAALKTIFGSDAVRAASVIYQDGAGGIQSWIDKTNDSGYAAETAATRLDNLSGDLEQFKGSLETALIGTGKGSQGPLRQIIQGATAATNAFNDLSPAAENVATGVLGITAVLGGGLWFTSKIVNGVSSMSTALEGLGVSSATTTGALKGVGRAATIAAAAIASLAIIDKIQSGSAKALPGLNELTGKLNELGQARVGDLPAEFDDLANSIERLADPNTAQHLQDNISDALGGIGGGSELKNARAEIEALDAALSNLVTSQGPDVAKSAFQALAVSAGLSTDQIAKLSGLLPGYRDALAGASDGADGAAGAQDRLASSTAGVTGATKSQTAALEKNIKAMQDKRTAALAAFDAETGYRQALKDATAQANKSNAGIRGNTDAALKNRGALSQLAAAWNNQSAAVQNTKGKFAEAKQSFIDTATAMGVPRAQARALARELLDIKPRSVKVTVETGAAVAALNGIQNYKLRDKYITVHTRNTGKDYDTGGYTGDGGKHEVAGLVHRGELVLPAEIVKRDRAALKARYSGLPGFAAGGMVGSTYSSRSTAGLDPLTESAHHLSVAFGNSEWSLKHELTVRSKLLTKALERDKAETEREKSRLDMLKQERQALMDAVKGNFTQTATGNLDLLEAARRGQLGDGFMSQVDTFTAAQGNSSMSLEDQVKAYLDSLSPAQLAQLQVQAGIGATRAGGHDAAAFEAALKEAVKNGLDPSGALFQQIASSGNLSFLQAFAGSPELIAQYQQAQHTANQQINALGQYAGNASLGQAIHDQAKVYAESLKVQHHMAATLQRNEKELAALNKKIDHLAKDTGKAVGNEINHTASASRRTP